MHAAEVGHAESLAQIGRHKTAGNSRTSPATLSGPAIDLSSPSAGQFNYAS